MQTGAHFMKKYWDKFVSSVKWLSLAMIAPAIVSAIYKIVGPHMYSHDPGVLFTTGIVTAGSCFYECLPHKNRSNPNWKGIYYSAWATVAMITGPAWSFSITGITIASAITIWLTMGAIKMIEVPVKIRKKQREALKQKEREELTARINQLIGDDSRTKALLSAIDRLTQYVPDVAERLLTAVADDAERYVMLRGLESTTKNEVLRQRCSNEASMIAEAARKLCADSTEMALELLRESQGNEADQALGLEYSPKIVEVNEEFKRFLEGLREALPSNDDKLTCDIKALGSGETNKLVVDQFQRTRGRVKNI